MATQRLVRSAVADGNGNITIKFDQVPRGFIGTGTVLVPTLGGSGTYNVIVNSQVVGQGAGSSPWGPFPVLGLEQLQIQSISGFNPGASYDALWYVDIEPESSGAYPLPISSATVINTIAPTGAVFEFAGSAAPSGFLVCDGSAVSRSTFAALFSVIGVTYGPGDGSTTFNLPDIRGRSVIGVGAVGSNTQPSAALGATGGDITQLVNHSHTVDATPGAGIAFNLPGSPEGTAVPPGGGGHGVSFTPATDTAGTGTTARQPFIAMNYVIKT